MKITIQTQQKADQFATIFQHLKLLTDHVNMNFTNEGLYMQCLDNNHCCLFECNLASKWFDKYEFDAEMDAAQIGIHAATFYKVINIRQDKQEIEISSEGSQVDTVNIHFTKGNNNFNKSFEIPIIDLESEMMDIPKDETSVDVVIDTKRLSELASELVLFSEILTLIFSEEGIEFTASGTEGKMKSSIDLDEVNEYAVGENMTLKQSYSLKYLNIMCHFGKLSKEISLGFSDGRPMHLTYNMDETKTTDDTPDDEEHEDDPAPKNYVSFYLAPRIDDD
jgi:proliferating cell nuclear antigen PCNA